MNYPVLIALVWVIGAVATIGYEFVNNRDEYRELIHEEAPDTPSREQRTMIALMGLVGAFWPISVPAMLHDWYKARRSG